MQNKIKIAIDLRPLMDPNESGVTVYIKAIVDELLKNHPEIEWILFYQASKRVEHIHTRYPQVLHLKRSNALFHLHYLLGRPSLPKNDFPVQPDLLWLPDRRPFYKTEFPCVMTVHDLIPEHQRANFSWKGRLWHRFFHLKKLLKNMSGILTPSLMVAQNIKTKLPKEITYEGADLAVEEECPPGIPKDRIKEGFFLMIAPADPRKHWDWVFAAAKRFPKLHFVFVGWKEKDHRFRAIKKEKLPNAVFLASVTEAQKKWLLKKAEALLALSSEEGFDLPVLEAVHAKCPVILSDIPIHRELYKANQWIKTEEDLCRTLYMFSIQGGRSLEVPKPRGAYTWEKASQRTLLFFLRILQNKDRKDGGHRYSHNHSHDAQSLESNEHGKNNNDGAESNRLTHHRGD